MHPAFLTTLVLLVLTFQFRMLLLDNQVQLSESDGIYTSSLMSDEDYSGADILILGNNYKKIIFSQKNSFYQEEVTEHS